MGTNKKSHPRGAAAIGRTRMLLANEPERRVAGLVPAWDESDVIRRMLQSMLARYDYRNYRVLVGVYLNDPAARVKLVQAAYQLETVVAAERQLAEDEVGSHGADGVDRVLHRIGLAADDQILQVREQLPHAVANDRVIVYHQDPRWCPVCRVHVCARL